MIPNFASCHDRVSEQLHDGLLGEFLCDGSSSSFSRLEGHGKIALIIAATVIIFLGTVLSIREGNRVKSLDEPEHLEIGKNLVTHFSFAYNNDQSDPSYDPAIPPGQLRPTAYRAPGYIFLIAPFIRLGAGYVELRIINFVLLASTLVLLYDLLVVGYSRLAGLLGIFFVLGYPVLVYAASTLYPQTFEAVLLVATIWLLDRTGPQAKLRVYGLAGLVFGLLLLTVPICLLLAPVVFLWLIFGRRSRIHQVALTVGVTCLLVGTWTARNYAVFNTFIPVASTSGYNLLLGNCPNTRYDQASADVQFPEHVLREISGKNEIQRCRIYTRAALQYMRENPGRTLALYGQKFLYWFHYRNDLMSDKVIAGGASSVPPWQRDLVMLFTYGPLLGLLVIRLALVRWYPLFSLEVLLLTLYVSSGMAYAIFYTRIRYRLPFDWLLITLDAIFAARVLIALKNVYEHEQIPPVKLVER